MNGYVLLLKPFRLTALVLLLLFVTACRSKSKNYEPTYSLDSSKIKMLVYGMPTQAFYRMTSPSIKYLNDHMDSTRIQLVASTTFLDYVKKLDTGYFDLTSANGLKTLEALRNGYSIVAEGVDELGNAGVILVNKDSSINQFSDLKNKTIATPGSPALGGHMLQMVYLFKKGLDVNKEVKFNYLESFESVILNIYLGKCSAGFTTITGWNNFIKQRPELASKVALKWQTPAVVGNALIIRDDVSNKTANQIKNLVLTMHMNEVGRKALANLGLVKYVPADSNTYEPMKTFLKEYRALIVDPKF
jgi:phosphonate transport system substrate-binding protein